ncbi:hypothetical protein OIDMADRAFT_32977 [Oidiodendron maius Zn]|uniref:Uncharacterized protein n=1 Tax=Oidiodendron maius (strain Zn) TaxID=913774 RepID=A0A0C3GJJ3_OIDMZ|nr:hypothetical protein OIDMADRAFT_32977 [Oidiodendron maius Zn]
MSAKDNPPIRGPGARQIAYALLLGEVVPKNKWNSWTFAQGVDRKAVQLRYSVPGRLEMESLYAQFLLRKFDETKETDVKKKCTLKDALEKRLDEEANEPPGESNIEFDDGGSIGNEYGSKEEGDMEDNKMRRTWWWMKCWPKPPLPMKAYIL